MELFDTHCHIHAAGAFEGEKDTHDLWARAGVSDTDGILKRARDARVSRIMCIGCNLRDSRLAVKFVQGRDNCWASVGIHPHEARHYDGQPNLLEALRQLTQKSKVVAIGETGLDYSTLIRPKRQMRLLKFQIELALECGLPIIFHIREAFDDFWPIFESYNNAKKPLRGVLHSFTDSMTNMERAINHGLYIGVNGISTFTKNAVQLEMYRTVPLEHLLLETDAPFLTPYPHRGKICEPYHIRITAEFLSNLRGETLEVVARATTSNARKLFGI